MRHFLPLAIAAILLGGCAAIEKAEHDNTENLLAAAGFKVLPANTPQRESSLAALDPYKIQRQIRGDKVYYVYPDDQQNFAFVGDQAAYSKYQSLVEQQRISDQNLAAAQMVSMPGVWPGWDYWGY